MFKKLVPVLALALLAGPAFAADAPASAPATDKPAATSTTVQVAFWTENSAGLGSREILRDPWPQSVPL